MTDPHQTVTTSKPSRRRHPALSVFMFLVGFILLLPGVCAIFFAIDIGIDDVSLAALWAVCLLISAGGVVLLVKTFR